MNLDEMNFFVNKLLALDNDRERGAIAKLKRSAGDPYRNFESLAVIGKWISDSSDRTFKSCILTAVLFSISKNHAINHRNFGESLAIARSKLKVGEESLDLRVAALLNAHEEDLPYYMVQLVRYVAGKEVTINYYQLIRDLYYWNSADKPVQMRWAKSYWAHRKEEELLTESENK